MVKKTPLAADDVTTNVEDDIPEIHMGDFDNDINEDDEDDEDDDAGTV